MPPKSYIIWLNGLLERFLDERLAGWADLPDDVSGLLYQAKHLCLAGGKRLRPFAAQLMYQTMGGQGQPERFGALELIHLFCLIHDDIIDGSSLRHGAPTVEAWYRERPSASPAVARSQGILAGDLVLAWALELFQGAGPAAQRELNLLLEEVIVGQMLDVHLMGKEHPEEAVIRRKTYLKTARYSVIQPLRIGAYEAGASDERTMEFCEEFGEAVGVGYQVQDDLLDIISPSEDKPAFQDFLNQEPTLFTYYLGELADKPYRKEWEAMRREEPSIARLRSLCQHSGAFTYGQQVIDEHFEKARQAAASFLPEDAAGPWLELVNHLHRRSY